MQHLPLSGWISIKTLRCIHIVENDRIPFFLMAEQYPTVYMYIYTKLYPFICWQTFRLFLNHVYCEYCCSEHQGTDISSVSCFHFLWTDTQKGNYSIIVLFLVFWGTSNTVFHPQWLHQFLFSATVHKGSLFSPSSTILATSCLFGDSHPNRGKAISHCDFHVHFLDD